MMATGAAGKGGETKGMEGIGKEKEHEEKCEWLIIMPDHEGVLEKRMAVRPYVVTFDSACSDASASASPFSCAASFPSLSSLLMIHSYTNPYTHVFHLYHVTHPLAKNFIFQKPGSLNLSIIEQAYVGFVS